jgi:DNA-binding NarL/FixJ family response regulator
MSRLDLLIAGITAPGPALSPRQEQVIGMVAKGMTRKAIARELWLSPETVKSHVEAATLRLGARNATHAAVLYDRGKRKVGGWDGS